MTTTAPGLAERAVHTARAYRAADLWHRARDHRPLTALRTERATTC